MWVVVKIMVPIIPRHLLFRVPTTGPIFLIPTHVYLNQVDRTGPYAQAGQVTWRQFASCPQGVLRAILLKSPFDSRYLGVWAWGLGSRGPNLMYF